MKQLAPFRSWSDVPLTCDVEDVSRITRLSVSTILELVRVKAFHPEPFPRVGKTSKLRWSKDELQAEYGGKHQERSTRKRCFKRVAA